MSNTTSTATLCCPNTASSASATTQKDYSINSRPSSVFPRLPIWAGVFLLLFLFLYSPGTFAWNGNEPILNAELNKTEHSGRLRFSDSILKVAAEELGLVPFHQGVVFNPFADTVKACGDSLVLDAGAGFKSYLWGDGSTVRLLTVRKSGWYKVSVIDSTNASAKDSCFVSLLPNRVQGNSFDCDRGQPFPFRIWIDSSNRFAGSIKQKVLWSTGDTSFSLSGMVTKPGKTFYARITDGVGACEATGFAYVSGQYSSSSVMSNKDSVILVTPTKSSNIYVWQWSVPKNAGHDSLIVRRSGTYTARFITAGQLCPWLVDYFVVLVRPEIDKNDTSICLGNSLPLTARFDTTGLGLKTKKILWSTGETTASIVVKPTQTTKYFVSLTVDSVSRRDSVLVNVVLPPPYNPLPDTLRPVTSSYTLDGGAGFVSYSWSNGVNTRTNLVSTTGKYRVTARSSTGCEVSDSVYVHFPDPITILAATVAGQCGMQIDLPIKAVTVKGLMTLQGSINWNASDLRFESISSYGPAVMGWSNANFGAGQSDSGILTFSWSDQKLTGVNLPDTVTLFTIRFTALGNLSRTVPVSVTGSPTILESYDNYFRKKTLTVKPGSVMLNCLATITGSTLTPLNEGVAGVEMSVTGTESKKVLTDKQGNFVLQVKPGNYTLIPQKINEKNKLNGVTTMDLALIQAHVLNAQLLSSPYKVIAADADASGYVSTIDIAYIRRMILGMDSSLPGNRTWALVDSSQVFANPVLPFPFTSRIVMNGVTGDVRRAFRAVKLGDVNWDRNPLLDQPQGADTVKWVYEMVRDQNGEYRCKVVAGSAAHILGFQLTLKWDPSLIRYKDISAQLGQLGVGSQWSDNGYLALSWNDPASQGRQFKPGDLLFELVFSANQDPQKAELSAGSWKVISEVFDPGYSLKQLVLEPADVLPAVRLKPGELLVYPNPANNFVMLNWNADQTETTQFSIWDLSGRKIMEKRVDSKKGVNSLRWNFDVSLPTGSILLLRWDSKTRQQTTKLMIVK